MNGKATIEHRANQRRKDGEPMRLPELLDRREARRPVIGITVALKEVPEPIERRPSSRFVRADSDYVEGVAEAGGVPVVLPPAVGILTAEVLLEGLDGLLLSGGSDLDPGYYGEGPISELGVTVPEWDAFDMALLGLALRRGMPIFGICRGMQLLNVALGGTLHQDLYSQLDENTLEHQHETPKWQPTHDVEILDDSYLAEITDRQSVEVNSYHHQGINSTADALTVSARSSDGVIEAVESRDFRERWLVGVQWHPEGMRDTSSEHLNLFEAHVRAASRYAA
jgi:putative glutamine amidotransferase